MYQNETDEKLHQICATNDELSNLLKQYEEENKFLLTQITHEIRNPLTLMYSTLQLIEHKNPDIKQINYWTSLKEDMKDVFSLLDRLSEYNHSDSLHIEPTDLKQLLTDCSHSLKAYAKERHASLSVTFEKDSLPYITSYPCDQTKIRQVIINLLKNAVEAVNEHGSILLSTDYDNVTEELLISITNTGSDISEEELSSLFTPFVTSKTNGTGLGLPTSKRIILSHNGTIDVVSANNKTTFTVKLPVA